MSTRRAVGGQSVDVAIVVLLMPIGRWTAAETARAALGDGIGLHILPHRAPIQVDVPRYLAVGPPLSM